MLETIRTCDKCGLCKHQKPLIDSVRECQVFWVGLSAKLSVCENEKPLSPTTNSGSLLCKIEENCASISAYRTNIVKCAPLDAAGKLRYPNKKEISICLPHIDDEIKELSPKVVFLLGNKVTEAISKQYSIDFKKWCAFDYTFVKHENLYFVPIHHPSYIYVYKRKQVSEYIHSIASIIEQLV